MLAWVWSAAALAVDVDPEQLLTLYEAVRVPLAQDRIDSARDGARSMSAASPDGIAAAASQVAASPDPRAMRLAFGELSRAVVVSLAAEGPPAKLKVFRCPMAEGWPFWLQTSSGISNPYMGLSMPTCGEGSSFGAAAKAALKAQ